MDIESQLRDALHRSGADIQPSRAGDFEGISSLAARRTRRRNVGRGLAAVLFLVGGVGLVGRFVATNSQNVEATNDETTSTSPVGEQDEESERAGIGIAETDNFERVDTGPELAWERLDDIPAGVSSIRWTGDEFIAVTLDAADDPANGGEATAESPQNDAPRQMLARSSDGRDWELTPLDLDFIAHQAASSGDTIVVWGEIFDEVDEDQQILTGPVPHRSVVYVSYDDGATWNELSFSNVADGENDDSTGADELYPVDEFEVLSQVVVDGDSVLLRRSFFREIDFQALAKDQLSLTGDEFVMGVSTDETQIVFEIALKMIDEDLERQIAEAQASEDYELLDELYQQYPAPEVTRVVTVTYEELGIEALENLDPQERTEIWRSVEAGADLEPVGNLPTLDPSANLVIGSDGSIYVTVQSDTPGAGRGLDPVTIQRSDDDGATWQEVASFDAPGDLVNAGDKMYFRSWGTDGVLVSSDGWQTYEVLEFGDGAGVGMFFGGPAGAITQEYDAQGMDLLPDEFKDFRFAVGDYFLRLTDAGMALEDSDGVLVLDIPLDATDELPEGVSLSDDESELVIEVPGTGEVLTVAEEDFTTALEEHTSLDSFDSTYESDGPPRSQIGFSADSQGWGWTLSADAFGENVEVYEFIIGQETIIAVGWAQNGFEPVLYIAEAP